MTASELIQNKLDEIAAISGKSVSAFFDYDSGFHYAAARRIHFIVGGKSYIFDMNFEDAAYELLNKLNRFKKHWGTI